MSSRSPLKYCTPGKQHQRNALALALEQPSSRSMSSSKAPRRGDELEQRVARVESVEAQLAIATA